MSNTPDDDLLVAAFLAAVEGRSLRQAAERTGVNRTTIAKLRHGRDTSSGWSYLPPATRKRIVRHLEGRGLLPQATGPAPFTNSQRDRLLELKDQLRSALSAEDRNRVLEIATSLSETVRDS